MSGGAAATGAAGAAPAAAPVVALIHYSAPPVIGGVEQVVAKHAALMAGAGIDVRVIAGRGGTMGPGVRYLGIPLLDSRHPAVLRLQRALDDGRIPAEFPRMVRAIGRELAAALDGVDVVIAHNVCSLNLNLALTAALHERFSRPGPARLIAWHHDLAWASATYQPDLHPGFPWDLLLGSWPGVRQVVVSETRRQELAELGATPADEIVVVPNGVDVPALWKLEAETRALLARTDLLAIMPLLLMPSRITPRKNVGLGLHVVAALRARGLPAGLVVTGPADPHHRSGGSYLDELRTLRAALGLEGCVWFLSDLLAGSPTDAMVHDLYRFADLLFLPSRDEGFGLPILEAAVNRLPIVCTGLPALRELAGQTALYIGPDDAPAEIAARIVSGIVDSPLARLSKRVQSSFSWEAIYRDRIAPLLTAG